MVVELARPGAAPTKAVAISQNASARGIRVATEHEWRPGDRVLRSFPETDFHSPAQVVHCQRSDDRFVVGLEFLLSPVRE